MVNFVNLYSLAFCGSHGDKYTYLQTHLFEKTTQHTSTSSLSRQVVHVKWHTSVTEVEHGPDDHGLYRQVVLVYRWSLYTGGPCIQVVLVYRWSLYTGGHCIQVVLVYR